MNPKLRNLVVAIGLVTAGASGVLIPLFVPKAGVTTADLLDAGAQVDCTMVALFCDAEFNQKARFAMADGGVDAGFRKRFARIGLPGFRCGNVNDGGLLLPPEIRDLVTSEDIGLNVSDCVTGTCAANASVCAAYGNKIPAIVLPPTHVKAPADGGLGCQRRTPLPDGGNVVRYFGASNVFSASEAVGTDCVPAANAFDSDVSGG